MLLLRKLMIQQKKFPLNKTVLRENNSNEQSSGSLRTRLNNIGNHLELGTT